MNRENLYEVTIKVRNMKGESQFSSVMFLEKECIAEKLRDFANVFEKSGILEGFCPDVEAALFARSIGEEGK